MNSIEVSITYTKTFNKQWAKCKLTIEDKVDLESQIQDFLNQSPENSHGKRYPGEFIQQTGGALKLRFTPVTNNQGKSGAYRIIYFVATRIHLIFLMVYPKNKKVTLSNSEKADLKKLTEAFKN